MCYIPPSPIMVAVRNTAIYKYKNNFFSQMIRHSWAEKNWGTNTVGDKWQKVRYRDNKQMIY